MKYYKRLNVYKASNVEFNPETNTALSYDWYEVTKKIKGKIIFNRFNYSPTTIKHKYKIKYLLNSLNIKIDHEIEAPKGLQNLGESLKYYDKKIEELRVLINRHRSLKRKNIERQKEIRNYKKQQKVVLGLMDIKQVLESVE